MGRASTQIVIFLILLTAMANVISASGVGAALEIDPHTQGEEEVDRVQEEAEKVEAPQGIADTLFALFISVTNTIQPVYNVIFAAPLMFQNLGVPSWLTTAFFAPMVVIVAADIVHVLTGRDP